MRQQMIIRSGEDEVGITKENDGSLYIQIRDSYNYERAASVSLTASQKQTLLDFLNKKEPREWVLEVEQGSTRIIGPYHNCCKETVKVREVLDE